MPFTPDSKVSFTPDSAGARFTPDKEPLPIPGQLPLELRTPESTGPEEPSLYDKIASANLPGAMEALPFPVKAGVQADAAIREKANELGTRLAEHLGKSHDPRVAAALGTLVAVSPDIALSLIPAGEVKPTVSKLAPKVDEAVDFGMSGVAGSGEVSNLEKLEAMANKAAEEAKLAQEKKFLANQALDAKINEPKGKLTVLKDTKPLGVTGNEVTGRQTVPYGGLTENKTPLSLPEENKFLPSASDLAMEKTPAASNLEVVSKPPKKVYDYPSPDSQEVKDKLDRVLLDMQESDIDAYAKRTGVDRKTAEARFNEFYGEGVGKAPEAPSTPPPPSVDRPSIVAKDYGNWKDLPDEYSKLKTRTRVNEEVEGKATGVLYDQEEAGGRMFLTARLKALDAENRVKALGFKPGTKESALMQQLGEGRITPQDVVDKVGAGKATKMGEALSLMRTKYDELLEEVNNIRVNRGLAPITHRPDYFTHFKELSLVDEANLLFGSKTPEEIGLLGKKMLTDSETAKGAYARFKTVIFNFEKRNNLAYTDDAIGGFNRYVRSAYKTIEMQRYVDELNKTADIVGDKLPNFSRYLKNQANFISTSNTSLDNSIKNLLGTTLYRLGIQGSRRYISGVVEANPGVLLSQLFGIPLNVAENGVLNSVKAGVSSLVNPELRSLAISKSTVLQDRVLDELERDLERGFVRKTLSRVIPTYFLDLEIGINGWIGAYQKALKTVGPEEAYKIANNAVSKTQGYTSIVDLPEALRSKAFQAVLPLQNQANTAVQYVWNELIRGGVSVPQAAKVARYVASLGAVGIANAVGTYAISGTPRSKIDIGDFIPGFRLLTGAGGFPGQVMKIAKEASSGDLGQATADTAKTAFLMQKTIPAPSLLLQIMKRIRNSK
jgi:hypothetical protein